MWVKFLIVSFGIISHATCQSLEADNDTIAITTLSTITSTQMTVVSSSTPQPENISCETHNNDCKECVKNTGCYFCETNSICGRYKEINLPDECDLKKIHYLTCKLNLQVMIIGFSVAGGVVLLIIAIACCCCCCKRKGIKISKDELKWARQRDERKQIAEERRKERAERTEQIRQKYGLLLDASGLVKDSNPYQRFDD